MNHPLKITAGTSASPTLKGKMTIADVRNARPIAATEELVTRALQLLGVAECTRCLKHALEVDVPGLRLACAGSCDATLVADGILGAAYSLRGDGVQAERQALADFAVACRRAIENSARSTDKLRLVPGSQEADRPEIAVGADEARVIDEGVAALARAPEVYVRGGEVVEVIADEPRTRGVVRLGPIARIAPCAEARVRELLARTAAWVGPDGAGGRRAVHPPQWAVRGVMARRQWPGLRPIAGVATAPTMRPDGSILSAEGYDAATGIYLAPSVAVSIADAPSRDDARRAVGDLLDIVSDFPAAPVGKAAWLAGLVSLAARPAIEGPIPMVILDASTRGAGKSLMADVASIIATGRPAARMIYSGDNTETRKTITALALAGDPAVLLDNVVGELGCAALDAALTADTWRDRILGASQLTSDLPMRIAWWATGNGLVIGADLARRSLMVRLEPDCERPEERMNWRYPRLVEHVRARRAELLGAALTIPRAYIVAGRPDMRLRPMGSYERWSDLARAALIWADQPDPCATIAELRAADARTDALRAVIDAWPAGVGEVVTAAELLSRAVPGSAWRAALIEWVPARGDDLPSARSLGMALRGIRRRIIAGVMVDSAGHGRGGAQWVRIHQGAGDDGDDGDDVQSKRGYDPLACPIDGRPSLSSHRHGRGDASRGAP